ncbi:F-box/WD repeat-containing protein 7-like [Patiria miniata]|uniref:F-box domain-containing protein n=1 Tax=Patiria miniata TaxID=46514 RepID=A0A913ZN96_PATMI|nr:F-box/WD repeat-containing protein 7-like [Patiria miniata]
MILNDMTVKDLCHVALCNRSWREAANQDALWRPLCQEKGWERYGTVQDICKEVPFKPTLQEQEMGEGGAPTFPVDAVVTGSDWPQLVTTCKWKEVYMKAKHLEENWNKNRFFVATLQFGLKGIRPKKGPAYYQDYDPEEPSDLDEDEVYMSDSNEYDSDDAFARTRDKPSVCNLAGEGDSLVAGINKSTLQIWDVSHGERQHVIDAYISNRPEALKMKSGVIAAGYGDGSIRTYSAQTGEQLQVMSERHRLTVSRLFFDGDTIVSAATPEGVRYRRFSDNDIWVWNAADGARRCILKSGSILAGLDYKDKIIAGMYNGNLLRIWEARSGACLHEIDSGILVPISCHLGDGMVIGVSTDFVVKVWNLESGKCVKTFAVPIDPEEQTNFALATSCVFNGQLLVVFSNSWAVTVMDLDGERIGTFMTSNRSFMQPVCFHGNKLVTTWWSSEGSCLYGLWMVDPSKKSKGSFKIDKFTDCLMEASHSCMLAWISDTKLVFEQNRQIVLSHYW